MMGHRVIVAVTLPLLGQGQGLGVGVELGPELRKDQASAPGLGLGLKPVSQEYTNLLPYAQKQQEAAELDAMTKARGVAPASESGLGPGLVSRLGRINTTPPPSSSSSSSFTLRRAYAAMWHNTLLSSQPRVQELLVLPLSPINANRLALALCPEGE